MDFDGVFRILDRLDKEGVEYAVVGGIALNLLGIERATRDLDLFVKPEREDLEGLVRALRHVFDDPQLDEIDIDEILQGDYPSVAYGPPDTDFHIDILTRLGDFVRFADLEIETLEVEGIEVRVISPKTLHWMKRGTVRPQDRADAWMLEQVFGPFEETEKEGD